MFDFPNSPTNGQQVQGGAGQFYAWDGVKWVGQMPPGPLPIGSGGTGVTTAAAAPWVELVGDTMTGTLNFSGPSGAKTHIFNDGSSHIEADDTLWLNGNTAADIRLGGAATSSKRITVNGPDSLNGHIAVIGSTNAMRILTIGNAAIIQGMDTGLANLNALWLMGTQVYLQSDSGATNLNLTNSGVAIKNAVTISQNTTTPTNSNGLYVVAANTQPGSVMVDGFGSGGFTQFLGRAARGTAAARTPVQTGDWLTLIRGQGAVDATNYSEACRLTFLARENWTPTTTGSYMQLLTVAPGTTTQEIPVTIGRGLMVGGSIANDPGPGGIYSSGNYTMETPAGQHPIIYLKKASGTTSLAAHILGCTGTMVRWGLVLGDGANETGGNAGSNFVVWRYNDTGALIDAPLSINRMDGAVSLAPTALVQGSGQSATTWSTTGAKGGCLQLIDFGQAAGNGGAVEFCAGAGGVWKFAAIKGYVTNGGGNSQGEIDFFVRVGASDTVLTRKGTLASDGVWYNTNASWSALSDVSLKENIAPYTNGLAAILGLRPVYFDYIEGAPLGASSHIGLVAQEAEEFVPEIVGEMVQMDAEPLKTTTPGTLIYTLINAIKELDARLQAGGF